MRPEIASTLQIPVYLCKDDILSGEVAFTVDLETARAWRRSDPPKAFSVNHGKGIELIRPVQPVLNEELLISYLPAVHDDSAIMPTSVMDRYVTDKLAQRGLRPKPTHAILIVDSWKPQLCS